MRVVTHFIGFYMPKILKNRHLIIQISVLEKSQREHGVFSEGSKAKGPTL